VDRIASSPFFNAGWYVRENPEVTILEMDPAEHYLHFGWRLGRNPSPSFDVARYLEANPDVAEKNVNPLLHYETVGRGERRKLAPGAVSPLAHIANIPVWKPPAADSPHFRVYETIKPAFDTVFYLLRYTDVAHARIDPVLHFIQHGAREGRNPSPDFNTKYYLQRYPDVAASGLNPLFHYLTIGRAEGRGAIAFSPGDQNFDVMCGMIGRPPAEVASDLARRQRDLRMRLEEGVLGQMVIRAGELEPLIHHSWVAAANPRRPPFHEQFVSSTVAMFGLQAAARNRRARAVVVVPHCRMGGSIRIAGHLAKALCEIYGPEQVLVLRTDMSEGSFVGWFPDECRNIDFAEAAFGMTSVDKQRVLVEFLRSLRPLAVFNVNSRLLWDSMTSYGKALASSMKLYAYLFCADKNIFGYWGGYPIREFYRHFEILDAIITDSHFLENDLRIRYSIPEPQASRITTLETPIIDAPEQISPEPRYGKPQIFWAGRFDRQKRVDVVLALAERMQDVEFHLWGEPVADSDFRRHKIPDNVVLEGVYDRITDLPLRVCDLWL
jgi:hypothetical protein